MRISSSLSEAEPGVRPSHLSRYSGGVNASELIQGAYFTAQSLVQNAPYCMTLCHVSICFQANRGFVSVLFFVGVSLQSINSFDFNGLGISLGLEAKVHSGHNLFTFHEYRRLARFISKVSIHAWSNFVYSRGLCRHSGRRACAVKRQEPCPLLPTA